MEPSEAVVGQDLGPNGVVGIGGMGDDPEALLGVMDEGDALGAGGGDGPVLAKEIQGVIGVETALEVEGEVEVEQRDGGRGAQAGPFFLEGFVPSLVGGQAGGAADMFVVVPVDLGLEQLVGLGVVLLGWKRPRRMEKAIYQFTNFKAWPGLRPEAAPRARCRRDCDHRCWPGKPCPWRGHHE